MSRLFDKVNDLAVVVDSHHTESGGLGPRDLDAAHGTFGTASDMVLQHQRVVHFVDMIARQHHDVLGVTGLDDVEVLVDGICGAPVPMLIIQALLSRQKVNHFIQFGAQETPAALQVA